MKVSRASKEFLRHCQVSRGYSENTLRNYRGYLTVFANWCQEIGLEEIEKLSLDDVEQFQLELKKRAEAPLSQKTVNYYLIAIRSLLRYLVNRDETVLSPDKITLSKTAGRQVRFLEATELARLRQAAADETLNGLRDRAIISLLYSTGLRISELVSLKRNQVGKNTVEFSVLGKGGKVRPVFLATEARADLASYLEARQDTNPYLFIRHYQNPILDSSKRPLSARSVQRMLQQIAKKAGIEGEVTPHKLRHSFATDLLRNGADLRSVQALLGHSSITTTQVYTHVTDKGLKDIHQRFHSQNTRLPEETDANQSS